MSSEIEAKEVAVKDLFSENFMFEIPLYQRPLTWTGNNFDELFEDIFDAMRNDEAPKNEQAQYFLGSVILQKDEKAGNKYDVVDGQQRISALAILMAVIRDSTNISGLKTKLHSYLFQEEDKYKGFPEEMRIIPWEELKEIFNKYIFRIGGTHDFISDFKNGIFKCPDEEDPRYHLYEAITVFGRKLTEKLDDPENLEKFVTYLLRKVYLVYIKTPSFISAFRLFTVLNSRGLPLTTSDLLKSENVGEIKDKSKHSQYAQIWRNMEEDLGREELENVIAFIRTIQLKEKAKLSMYEEYRKELFDKRVLERGTKFIDYVKEIADIYNERILDGGIILRDKRKQNEYKCVIDLLRRYVPFFDWIPPVLSFYRKFRIDEYLLDFILKLEKKVVRLWAAGLTPTERITSLNRVIKLTDTEEKPEKVVNGLLYCEGEEDSARNWLDESKNKLNSNQFYTMYGGRLARYILLRLDMTYWDLENFTGYPGMVTVEHILPQTPSEGDEWMKLFNEKDRTEWTNRLGNLVLLSGRKNSSAQNYDFARKKTVYFKNKSTPFKITQELEDQEKWTMQELTARHKALCGKAYEIFIRD